VIGKGAAGRPVEHAQVSHGEGGPRRWADSRRDVGVRRRVVVSRQPFWRILVANLFVDDAVLLVGFVAVGRQARHPLAAARPAVTTLQRADGRTATVIITATFIDSFTVTVENTRYNHHKLFKQSHSIDATKYGLLFLEQSRKRVELASR